MEQKQYIGERTPERPKTKADPARTGLTPRKLFEDSTPLEENFMAPPEDEMEFDTSDDSDTDPDISIFVASGAKGELPADPSEIEDLRTKITTVPGYHIEFKWDSDKGELHYQSVKDEVALAGVSEIPPE